jgi:hypothetical protein
MPKKNKKKIYSQKKKKSFFFLFNNKYRVYFFPNSCSYFIFLDIYSLKKSRKRQLQTKTKKNSVTKSKTKSEILTSVPLFLTLKNQSLKKIKKFMSLFGSATIGADNRRLLLTLRAGRMFKNSQDNLIHPDVRSGILSFTMEASGVIEMKWEALAGDSKNSSSSSSANASAPGNTNPPSESTVIMPGGAKFDRVTKCTTGRVFVIDFGTRQLFYWLQEQPDAERDQNYFRAIKNAIEGKTRQGASTATGGAAASSSSTTGGSSSSSAAANNNNNNQAGIQLAALQNILTNLGGPGTTSTTNNANATNASPSPANNAQSLAALMNQMSQNQQRGHNVPRVTLQDVIRSQPAQDALRADPAFYMSRLFDSLPPDTDPAGDVVENVMNPQFASSASALSSALADPDGYREIMHAFGLQAPAGVPPSPWGLLQAVLNEKPQEKNKTGEDAAPASTEGTNNNSNNDKKGGGGSGGDNTDAASV